MEGILVHENEGKCTLIIFFIVISDIIMMVSNPHSSLASSIATFQPCFSKGMAYYCGVFS